MLVQKNPSLRLRHRPHPAQLATRIADAIWWNWSTPLGYAADRATLEDIVAHVARKLRAGDHLGTQRKSSHLPCCLPSVLHLAPGPLPALEKSEPLEERPGAATSFFALAHLS